MKHAPFIDNLSRPLVRMFELFHAEPERWFTVGELIAEAKTSQATVYRRCGNLVAARVLQHRRDGQAEFRLHPDWASMTLGKRLLRRLPTPPDGTVSRRG